MKVQKSPLVFQDLIPLDGFSITIFPRKEKAQSIKHSSSVPWSPLEVLANYFFIPAFRSHKWFGCPEGPNGLEDQRCGGDGLSGSKKPAQTG
jgi:hypothetical protein